MRALAIAVLLVPALVHAGIDEKGFRIGLATFPVHQTTPQNAQGTPRPGPSSVSLGSYVTVRVSSSFAFQWEAVFARKGSQSERCMSNATGGSSCVDVSHLDAYYLELPLLMRVDLLHGERSRLYLVSGAELAIHLGTAENIPDRSVVNFKPANGGVVVGLGVQFGAGPGRIALDARYKKWFAPLKDADLANNMSVIESGHQLVASIGYAFP